MVVFPIISKKMKTSIVFLVLLLPCLVFGQSVERSVIAAFGTATVTGSGIRLSQTAGEAMVHSYSGTLMVSEGFQQGSSNSVSATDGLEDNASFTVYPNPVGTELNVRIESTRALDLELSFYDLLGRSTVLPTTQVKVNGSATETIDCAGIASGTYLLTIRDLKSGNVKSLQIRKVD
jgi:hypothetical protein